MERLVVVDWLVVLWLGLAVDWLRLEVDWLRLEVDWLMVDCSQALRLVC